MAAKNEGFDYGKFFDALSNVWASVMPAEMLSLNATSDGHPQNNLRINVNAQMLDPIYDKLGVAEGDGMYLPPEERIAIWGPKA